MFDDRCSALSNSFINLIDISFILKWRITLKYYHQLCNDKLEAVSVKLKERFA